MATAQTGARPLTDNDLDEDTVRIIRAALMGQSVVAHKDLKASQQTLLFAALIDCHVTKFPQDRILTNMTTIICTVLGVSSTRAGYVLNLLRLTGLRKTTETPDGLAYYIDLSPLPALKRLVKESTASAQEVTILDTKDNIAFACIRRVVSEGNNSREFATSSVYTQAALVSAMVFLDPGTYYTDGWLNEAVVDIAQAILGVPASRAIEVSKKVHLFAHIESNRLHYTERRSRLVLRENTPFAELILELKRFRAWAAQNRHD